ncbi:MAG: AsmA family protein [Alphaproteobacteria bacterium]|nr:AsmA family protein [Alphaproteobacteria bacterium]
MWRVLRWVLLVLVLLVGALVALPFLLPTSVYKDQIVEQVRLATGRALAIDGDLKLSFFPALGVEVNKVRFANVAGSRDADMASMETLVVGAELWPLLSGSLKVTEIRLVKPVIHLEIDKDGRGNWLFEPQSATPGAPVPAQPSTSTSSADFSFRDVTLSDGTLTYRDARTGTDQRVDAVNASVKLPSLDQPLTFKGGLTWNKEAITIDTEVANPRALSSGGKSDLKTKIDAEVMSASFAGDIDAATSAIAGKVDFKTRSARRLAAWAGVDLPKVRGFGPMALSGDLESTTGRIAFKHAKVSLDGMNGSGNLALETARAVPYVKGDFTLDQLNLNPYMGSGAEKSGGGGGGAVGAWSDAPIDLSALKLVDADLDFAVNALQAGGLKIGRSALDIALAGGKMRATLKQLALYGGNGSGLISLNGSGGVPQFGLDVRVAGVQGEPFLTDAAGFNRLSGTASIVAKVAGGGRSQRAWMKSLGGTAAIKFEDGAIKGINLAEIARTIQSALSGSATGGSAKTDFAELSGSFVIRNGVAANKDLRLLNPFVRLNGAGIIDLGNQTLDYRIEPKAVSSIKGQGGQHDLGGIGIPFRIKGPWSNPSYEPDLSGVLNSAVDSILKGDNPLDSLKNGAGGLIPGLGGQPAQQEGAPAKKGDPKKKPKGENPLDSLKGLLGGGK